MLVSSLAPFRAYTSHSASQSRRRILHVIFSSRIAGSERYCVDLANRQAELGHEVHVAGSSSSPLRHAMAPAVHFHGIGRLLRSWRLRRLIGCLQPDICHGHLSTACKALGRTAGAHRTVATLHVGYKAHQHGRLNGLISVNHAQAARIHDYAGTVRTIANWQPATPELPPRGVREELGLTAKTFVVGAVGRLHASKGNDVLIQAFRAAAPANAALVILGDGPQRKQLELLRAGDDRIYFLGYRPEVHGCLRDLDLFVSPSREESFGLAIIEAMSVGLPVIATSAEGPAEYLRDQPVTLVPPGDVAALTGALQQAAAHFETGLLTRHAYDLGAFDPAARVANVMDFYGQLIAARSPKRAEIWVPSAVAT